MKLAHSAFQFENKISEIGTIRNVEREENEPCLRKILVIEG
jgi:hypothetical protein